MSKMSRFKYHIAEKRGTAYTIAANTTLTAANILQDGYGFIKINGAYTLTLPVASSFLKGIVLIIAGNNGSSAVTVAAGFGGGGTSFDSVTIGAYNTIKVWCDGSNWHACGESVTA